jgi:hypothetical protein
VYRNPPLAIVLSLLFGFVVWTALALGIGGRYCTDTFEWGMAVSNYVVETLFLFLFWVPGVLVVAYIAYFASPRIRNPRLRALTAVLVVALVFVLAVAFTHKVDRCPDF